MEKAFAVYILANQLGGTLYIGVTSNLPGRVYTHKEDILDGFTQRYGVHKLVYFEMHGSAEAAITREKQLKKWNRAWKVRLIEGANPNWDDLYPGLFL
ncbi:MAG TPA: GIY-YIG nuclease family protein [Arsenicitalea sp.]|nr:GIY-YIG nuclease family protein [Arsenicitalea sp.]